NSTAHESPIQSWNLIRPSVVSASKSGAVSPICNPIVMLPSPGPCRLESQSSLAERAALIRRTAQIDPKPAQFDPLPDPSPAKIRHAPRRSQGSEGDRPSGFVGGALQGGDVDLLHAEHCAHGPIGPGLVGMVQ